jgi:glycosyltransferase involved in cell wall biosynthesis
LLSKEAWLSHPVRSAARLIPLHAKEFINRMYPVFDLSFYLQFRPRSLEIGHQVVTPLRYYPQPSAGRQRIAFVTPHLGPGGAEKSLLDIVESLDRAQFEIFLIATHPGGAEWRKKWNSVADHVYDLGGLIPAEKMPGAVYSLTANWKFETLVVQNSLPAYAAVLNIRRDSPGIKVIDIVHAVGDDRDLVQATQAADPHIDLRIAISEAARARLLDTGTAGERIRLIRNGIDLAHFRPAAARAADPAPTVLFAGRLDPVKRPLMLVDIALELKKLALSAGTRFLVAGDGPEWGRLQDRVQGAKLREEFVFLGAVDDIRPVLAQAHVVVLPSQWEGIPFIVLEALALERPVVCSQVGALDEVVSPHTGILVKTGQGEVRRFAMALQSLLSDPRRRRAMGEAGRRMVERDYDQARSRRQYQELFA